MTSQLRQTLDPVWRAVVDALVRLGLGESGLCRSAEDRHAVDRWLAGE